MEGDDAMMGMKVQRIRRIVMRGDEGRRGIGEEGIVRGVSRDLLLEAEWLH